MSVVVNNELVLHATKLLFGTEATYPWTVRLYVNVRQPNPADVLSAYVACSVPGYADVALVGANWVGGITTPGVAVYLYEPISCMTVPPMQWGYPRTVEGFFHALSRGQYGTGEGTCDSLLGFIQLPLVFVILACKRIARSVADATMNQCSRRP